MVTETLVTHSIYTQVFAGTAARGAGGLEGASGCPRSWVLLLALLLGGLGRAPGLIICKAPSSSDVLFLLEDLRVVLQLDFEPVVQGHRLWSQTACPGPTLRSAAHGLLDASGPLSVKRASNRIGFSGSFQELSVRTWGSAWPTLTLTQGLATTSIVTSSRPRNWK